MHLRISVVGREHGGSTNQRGGLERGGIWGHKSEQ